VARGFHQCTSRVLPRDWTRGQPSRARGEVCRREGRLCNQGLTWLMRCGWEEEGGGGRGGSCHCSNRKGKADRLWGVGEESCEREDGNTNGKMCLREGEESARAATSWEEARAAVNCITCICSNDVWACNTSSNCTKSGSSHWNATCSEFPCSPLTSLQARARSACTPGRVSGGYTDCSKAESRDTAPPCMLLWPCCSCGAGAEVPQRNKRQPCSAS
jgi:hypothetical protein